MPETMKAVVVTRPGGPEVLELREVERPEVGPGQVRVQVAASGVNRADLLQRLGRYPVPDGFPKDILGLEYSGTVHAIGDGVDGVYEGDRVMGILGGGGCAEYVVVDARELIYVPADIDLVEAGAIPEAFLTAFDASVIQGQLQEEETLLIHAVGSGVGTAAMQLGRYFGARVIGTSRTQSKLDRAAEMGLEHPVMAGESWEERVNLAGKAKGVHVILDLVGGPYIGRNIQVLAQRGRIIVVGVTGGPQGPLNLRALMVRQGSITGTVLRSRPLEDKIELALAFTEKALPGLAQGKMVPVIDQTFAPDKVAEAHTRMEDNLNFGKLLLVW